MGRYNTYRPIVEKCLKNKSLSYEEIKTCVIPKLGTKRVDDKNLKEALMTLLEENEISLSGYKFGSYNDTKDRRMQSIPVQGLIFEWLKKMDHWEIYDLLRQMENWTYFNYEESNREKEKDKDDKDKKNPKTRLKSIFKKKFKEYEKKEEIFHNSILKKVKVLPAIQVYKKEMEYFEKIKSKYIEEGIDWGLDKSTVTFRRSLVKRQLFYKNGNLSKHSKIMKVCGLTQDDARKITTHHKKYVIKEMDEDTLNDYMRKLFNSKMEWLDIEGSSTPESYLKMWDFPIKKSNDQINSLFDNILFFINTHENYKFLKQSFSLALSDEKGSSDSFEFFINFVPTIPLYPKLQKKFGFKEVKPYI